MTITIDSLYENADEVMRFSGFIRDEQGYKGSSGRKITVAVSQEDGGLFVEVNLSEIGMVGYLNLITTELEADLFFQVVADNIELHDLHMKSGSIKTNMSGEGVH